MSEIKETSNIKEPSLQIELDLNSYSILKNIMEELDIPTYGELIRRSLELYEMANSIIPNKEVEHRQSTDPNTQGIKRLHIRLTSETKDRLDRIKNANKSTYAETVIGAIIVLAQIGRNKKQLMSGDKTNDDTGNPDVTNMRRALAMVLA